MVIVVLFTLLFNSQNILATSTLGDFIKIGDVPNQHPDPPVDSILDKLAVKFPKGIIPYFIETASYDPMIVTRIQTALDLIEASSCLIFKQIKFKPITVTNGSWVHFTNPEELRDCVHHPTYGPNGEIIIILGYECMMFRNIVHAILHAIGFKDEVSHPHRDQYIRIMWENIQPRYRDLFRVQNEKEPYKIVEYDPMSVMHFHDRAFSINGGPTITARMPGLLINPSDKLSQLDVMKLRMWFGHECNKRKVGALLEKCKTVFHNSHSVLAGTGDDAFVENVSVDADNVNDPYDQFKNEYDDYGQYDNNAGVVDPEAVSNINLGNAGKKETAYEDYSSEDNGAGNDEYGDDDEDDEEEGEGGEGEWYGDYAGDIDGKGVGGNLEAADYEEEGDDNYADTHGFVVSYEHNDLDNEIPHDGRRKDTNN